MNIHIQTRNSQCLHRWTMWDIQSRTSASGTTLQTSLQFHEGHRQGNQQRHMSRCRTWSVYSGGQKQHILFNLPLTSVLSVSIKYNQRRCMSSKTLALLSCQLCLMNQRKSKLMNKIKIIWHKKNQLFYKNQPNNDQWPPTVTVCVTWKSEEKTWKV